MDAKVFEQVINHLNAERLSLLIALAQAQVELETLRARVVELETAATLTNREWE